MSDFNSFLSKCETKDFGNGKGKGIIAKVPLHKGIFSRIIFVGEIIMEVNPFSAMLHKSNWNTMCFYCFKESDSLKRCSKCKLVKYCSRDCQAQDWREHEIECKSIERLKPISPASLVLFIARLLRLEYGNIKRKESEENSFNRREYAMNMINHLSEVKKEEEKEEISELAMLTLKFIHEEENWIKNLKNEEILTKIKTIISQIKCNDFTLCKDYNNQPMAHGCYPIPSLINHSCDPNVFYYYKGRKQIFRCCKEIKIGEELFISYIDLNISTKSRQKYLLDNYYFKCECERCMKYNNNNHNKECNEDDDGLMEYFKCQYCFNNNNNNKCYCIPNLENGYECVNCHKSSSEIINKNKIINENEYKKYNECNDLNEKIKHIECVYDSAKILYHCSNPKLTKICEEYVKLLITIPNYELALEPCRIWKEGNDLQYPAGSIAPYIAHAYYSKLLYNTENVREALKESEYSYLNLKMLKGEDDEDVKDVKSIFDQCILEIGQNELKK